MRGVSSILGAESDEVGNVDGMQCKGFGGFDYM